MSKKTSQRTPRKARLIEVGNLVKIKQRALLILIGLHTLLFVSACAYEPKTMVKIPRALETSISSNIKKTTSIKNKLKNALPHKIANSTIKKQRLPIIEIDLSKFKNNLIGLNKFEIIELLDTPKFKRTEHPASIWQYQSFICFVDIFFYTHKKDMVVDHVEIRSKNVKNVSEKICFASLLDPEYAGGISTL
nr:hypothetical protein [Rhodospirillales bacterium]